MPGSAKDFAATLLLAGGTVHGAPEYLYTVEEVAAALRISKATVYKLCNTGRLDSVRVVNVIRVPASAHRRFVEQRNAP